MSRKHKKNLATKSLPGLSALQGGDVVCWSEIGQRGGMGTMTLDSQWGSLFHPERVMLNDDKMRH